MYVVTFVIKLNQAEFFAAHQQNRTNFHMKMATGGDDGNAIVIFAVDPENGRGGSGRGNGTHFGQVKVSQHDF